MNKMAEVAKILGVEIGEEFKIKNNSANDGYKQYVYKFEKNNLYRKDLNSIYDNYELSTLQVNTLLEVEIIKLPFIPKLEEIYYYIYPYTDENGIYNWGVNGGENYFGLTDIYNLQNNNCFRTYEEAEQNKQRIIDLLSPYIVEVENE